MIASDAHELCLSASPLVPVYPPGGPASARKKKERLSSILAQTTTHADRPLSSSACLLKAPRFISHLSLLPLLLRLVVDILLVLMGQITKG